MLDMKELLREKKMTQRDLAVCVNLPESHINQIVNRQIKFPIIATMRAISAVLGRTVDELWPAPENPVVESAENEK